MSNWNHSICERCWIEREATWNGAILESIKRPAVLLDPDLEQCAFCGEPTIMGIFVRHDPADVPFPKESSDV